METFTQTRSNKVNRRDLLKLMGIGAFLPTTLIKEAKPKVVREVGLGMPKFKVGDVVKYVRTAKRWGGYMADEMNNHDIELYKGYIGNKCIISKVSPPIPENLYCSEVDYATTPLDPMPFTAWHSESTLELVKSIDEFLGEFES